MQPTKMQKNRTVLIYSIPNYKTFGFFEIQAFTIHLDIVYVQIHSKSNVPEKPKHLII